eukprot:jgi/Botrbrau1/7830/Bobra.9_2s0011.1
MIFHYVFVISACLAVSATVVIGAAVVELRKRAGKEAQAEADSETENLVSDRTVGHSHGARNFSAIFPAILLLILGTSFYYLWKPTDTAGSLSCKPPDAKARVKLFGNLGGLNHPIVTNNPTAQNLFNQGMLFAWAFNQLEAQQSFLLASELDPNASMPYWGLTYAMGPGANKEIVEVKSWFPSFGPGDFPECHANAEKALALAQQAAEANPDSKEAKRDLAYAKAAAIRFRDGSELNPERYNAEVAYGHALRDAGREFKDGHMLALAAEALMNTHQWDYYNAKGQLRPEAVEAEGYISEALMLDPDNALALHLQIHLAEAGSSIQEMGRLSALRGVPSADTMTYKKGPWWNGQGHLLHMPGHLYIRVGNWHGAVLANVHAYEADKYLSDNCLVPYFPEHNTAMLVYAALMGGEIATAEKYALKLSTMQTDFKPAAYPFDTFEWTFLPLTWARIGRWDAILDLKGLPEKARGLCFVVGGHEYATVVWHYVRTLAYAGKAMASRGQKRVNDAASWDSLAHEEMESLKIAEEKVPEEATTVPGDPPGIYACDYKTLARIMKSVAASRLALLHGRKQEAVGLMQKAVSLEDHMGYMEPPRLYQPMRQCLAYLLLTVLNKPTEAEQEYRQDLKEYPSNGWSLLGLSQSLEQQGLPALATEILEQNFTQAWKYADIEIESSCPAFAS